MATTYNGINYFPLNTGFGQKDIIELLEATVGIKGPYAVLMLLCKIYSDGYYIPWGEEQCIIFARKLGPEYSKEIMDRIIDFLVEREFFDRENYLEHKILTSKEIQKVWLEATYRRKRDLNKLPYLIIAPTDSQNTGSNAENDNIPPTEVKHSPENDDIFRQSKVKQSKAEKSKELPPSIPPEGKEEMKEEISSLSPAPEYAYNRQTHNYEGLLVKLKQLGVVEAKEVKSILQLSDYGRKFTLVWQLFSKVHWEKISEPGKYIIATLVKNR